MGSPRGNLLQKVIPAKKDHTFCVRINWEHLPSCELVIQIHTVWVIVLGNAGRYLPERKHFKTFPWTTASKRIKYPGINFIKEKRHKPLMKETEEDTKKLKAIPC